jgi:tetratricopeptide (TPR) repeat protein
MKKLDASQVDQIEMQLKKGNHVSVRDTLKRVVRKDSVHESLLLRVSQLARRVDAPTKGLMLLRDRVLDVPFGSAPHPAEVVEYAACLLKVGGFSECIRMLSQPSVKNLTEAIKTLAFAFIHQWDYENAIPLLKQYLSSIDRGSYSHLVGSMNLASALVEVESFEEAQKLLQDIVLRAKNDGHLLLLGNAHELLAQIHISTRNWADVESALKVADDLLTSAQPRYRLYIDKWRALAALIQAPSDLQAIQSLKLVRERALNCSSVETLRECDFYEAVLLGDQNKFLQLYFGTPYPSYRKKILSKSEGRFEIPRTYCWKGCDKADVLDMTSGSLGDGRIIFKKQQGLHKTIWALTRDFYAPISLPELFNGLFDNEYFHHESSPHRLRELVRRTKVHLSKLGVPVHIDAEAGGFKIDIAKSKLNFLVTLETDLRHGLLGEIKSIFGNRDFSLRDLAMATARPHTTIYRELKGLIGSGEIEAKGQGKTSTYVLAKASKPIKLSA